MNPERLEQIEALYNDALAVQPSERPSFLDRACGADVDFATRDRFSSHVGDREHMSGQGRHGFRG
jgi:hypothetical protein